MVRPRGTDSAEVIQVIRTKSLRGEGTQQDLCRIVTQYWDFDGNLLAENDPCAKEKEQFPTLYPFEIACLDQVQEHLYTVVPGHDVRCTIGELEVQ